MTREAFEAWSLREGYYVGRESDKETYCEPAVHAAWWAWQESREQALEEVVQVLELWVRTSNEKADAAEDLLECGLHASAGRAYERCLKAFTALKDR